MFCKTVWNGLHILPDGYIRLCSIGQNTDPKLDMQRCRDRDGNVMHILTHSIQDIMNSDKHREVRRLNVADPTAWSPHCDCCENREIVTGFDRSHKNKSRRVYLMRIEDDVAATEENHLSNGMSEDGSIDWMPSSLDIRFGNLCNQKCIMCSPVYSNLWYEEYSNYYGDLKFGQGNKIVVKKDELTKKWIEPMELQWYDDPRWWPKFESMMPYLKHIYITGGEPMVTPAHDVMLDKLIESGYAKNILLEYDTNCSAVNDKIAQRWFHFKKVEIRGSMDSIEQEYEIIRFPGNWDKFQKNVKKLKQYEIDSNRQIELLALSTCFQMSTMWTIMEAEEWCKSVGIPFHMRFLEGPKMHSVTSLSDDEKMALINHYEKYTDTSEKAVMIVRHLKNHMGPKFGDPNEVKKFIKFMDYLDTTRSTSWKTVFPKVYELIKHYQVDVPATVQTI